MPLAPILAHLRRRRESRSDLGAVLLLPLALMPIERRIDATDRPATTESAIEIAATLDLAQEGGVRRASFEHGVLFIETITEWEPERRLVLRSRHRVRTRFNAYAGWWADRVMASVQGEILRVIKARAERTDRPPKAMIRAATAARLARETADARNSNSLDIGFSVVGMLDGRTDVYPDSVVVLVRDGHLRAQRLTSEQTLDSVTASLAGTSGAGWGEGPPSNAVVLELVNHDGQEIPLGPIKRFTIPRAPGESLEGRWVVFTFHLTVPKTAENPYGKAWTYTHARKE